MDTPTMKELKDMLKELFAESIERAVATIDTIAPSSTSRAWVIVGIVLGLSLWVGIIMLASPNF